MKNDAPAQPGRNPASRSIGKWEPKQKRNVWKQDKRNCYVEHASAEAATPLLDRLEAGSGPVRHLPVDSWPILQVNKELRYCVPDTRHLAGVWR